MGHRGDHIHGQAALSLLLSGVAGLGLFASRSRQIKLA
jgi:hypothetical protein